MTTPTTAREALEKLASLTWYEHCERRDERVSLRIGRLEWEALREALVALLPAEPIDRGDAVNLARLLLAVEDPEPPITGAGIRCLASAVLAMDEYIRSLGSMADVERDAVLEEAENAMLDVFAEMNEAYLVTSGFDSRIIQARDAIRALKRQSAPERSK